MKSIGLEPTNHCRRACRHCFRNRADPPGFLPLEIADAILAQARPLGISLVCLTGGEIALYPQVRELLRLITGRGFDFTLVTSGQRFREAILPALLEAGIRARLVSVSISLDGAQARTHEALRGPKSFREALEAITLCQNHQLPFSLKTVLTTANRGELTELALLGARLGATSQGFLYPLPSPDFIRSGLLPSPEEAAQAFRWLAEHLVGITRQAITLEGFEKAGVILDCGHLTDFFNVDCQGNLTFCCILSHYTRGDGRPTATGPEVLADLKQVPLKDAIASKFTQAARIVAARLAEGGKIPGVSQIPCLWCLQHFGNLAWLEEFPESPWNSWLLD